MIPTIVMRWQHKYYNIFDGYYHILSTDHEIIPNLKTNHSKHIRWSCCPSMWCSLYEKRRSVVMWSHKVQHKQPTSYVALDFKIEAPFISYFYSSCFIPYRMLIYINYKFKSTTLFSAMLNTTTYMTLLFVILGFTLPSLIWHIRPFAFTSGSKLYEQYW